MVKKEERFSNFDSAKSAIQNLLKKNNTELSSVKSEVFAYPSGSFSTLKVFSGNAEHGMTKLKNTERGAISIHCSIPMLSVMKENNSDYTVSYYSDK